MLLIFLCLDITTLFSLILKKDAIQAFCAGKDQLAIDQKLQVMQCYQIKGYACTGSDKSTAVLSKNVTIRMGAATSIVPVNDVETIPSTYFEFGTYADIERMSITRDEVIGTCVF